MLGLGQRRLVIELGRRDVFAKVVDSSEVGPVMGHQLARQPQIVERQPRIVARPIARHLLAAGQIAAAERQLVITLADSLTTIPSLTATQTSATSSTPADTATPTSTPSTTSTGTQAQTNSLIFVTDADARVKQSSPSTNYGNATTLQVDGASDPDIESFHPFHSHRSIGYSPKRAAARVCHGQQHRGMVRPFTQQTLPGQKPKSPGTTVQPVRARRLITKAAFSPNTWVEYDVTSLVTGNGTFSFVLAADSNDSVSLFFAAGQPAASTGD